MSESIACALIVSEKRSEFAKEHILPTLLTQGFDEVVAVGDFWSGDGYRHLLVPPITRTTIDALIKRETALSATKSEVIVYICDDHRLSANFGLVLRENYLKDDKWGYLIPNRFCIRDGKFVTLNMGASEFYCGGHAGIFRREALRAVPWMVAPHDPPYLWDKWHSHMLNAQGFHGREAGGDLLIEDIEPLGRPWL